MANGAGAAARRRRDREPERDKSKEEEEKLKTSQVGAPRARGAPSGPLKQVTIVKCQVRQGLADRSTTA